MLSPFAHLSFWHAALGTGAAPPPACPLAETAIEDVLARAFARRLREQPAASRGPLLSVLRGQASVLPWSAIHPSWLEPILAEYPERWRTWALAALPASLRGRIDEERAPGGPRTPRQAPSWWPAYFAAHVRHRLGYPELVPWRDETTEMPGALWERTDVELARRLAVHGTRGFVSAVRWLPRSEAQTLLWKLPAQCQPVAQDTVARGFLSDDPFWREVLDRLAEEFPLLEARLLRMALADWLRVGLARGQERLLRRLSLRLPRRWGEWMQRVTSERPDWLIRPERPGREPWEEAFGADPVVSPDPVPEASFS